MNYCLYNPLSNNKKGKERIAELNEKYGPLKEVDVTELTHEEMREFCAKLDKKNDIIYLVGGDGTLFHFANSIYGLDLPTVYFRPAGTGNDFCNDLGDEVGQDGTIQINKYLKQLPKVYINGQGYRFVNGVGYGVDGVCCEVADEIRQKSDKPINYAAIAVKQCLYKFKRRDAYVTVDGETTFYKNVWICPTMNGRFYGGGIMVAPNQNRLNSERKATVVVGHTRSRLKILLTFPKIFTGDHVKSSCVEIIEGKNITVKFTKPCAIQVDGETTKNVSEYTVVSNE